MFIFAWTFNFGFEHFLNLLFKNLFFGFGFERF